MPPGSLDEHWGVHAPGPSSALGGAPEGPGHRAYALTAPKSVHSFPRETAALSYPLPAVSQGTLGGWVLLAQQTTVISMDSQPPGENTAWLLMHLLAVR